MDINTVPDYDSEIKFWQEFIKTERFLEGWAKPIKTPELNEEVYAFITALLTPETRVLDVGSGVVSILHGTVPANQLMSLDALGDCYQEIFDYEAHGIPETIWGTAEDLALEDHFDIVHISNALDHCQNPARAYDRLLRATRPGGFLIVQGFVKEGTWERWTGLHQWDISLTHQGALFIANKQGGGVTIGKNRVTSWETTLQSSSKRWFIWVAQKPA